VHYRGVSYRRTAAQRAGETCGVHYRVVSHHRTAGVTRCEFVMLKSRLHTALVSKTCAAER
jgi:hypothetical protein